MQVARVHQFSNIQTSYRRSLQSFHRFTRQQYYSFFLDADKDNDGYLSKAELKQTLEHFGFPFTTFDLDVMFRKADLDNNGFISLDEYWVAMGQPTGRSYVCKVLVRMFHAEDRHLTGRVSWHIFMRVLSTLRVSITTLEFKRLEEVAAKLESEKDVVYDEFIHEVSRLWEKVDEMEIFWRRADADGDGFLTLQELMIVLKKEGYTEAQIKARFMEMDRDGDGKITYREYMFAMMSVSVHVHKTALMRKLFARFDTNKDGKIGKKEMRIALSEMGKHFSEKQMEDIMLTVDKDKSGEIEFEEFVEQIDEIFAMQDAYQKFFHDADIDHSGYLTVGELVKALRAHGYKGTERDIKRMFFDTDIDSNKQLDFEEYMVAMGKQPPVKHKEAVLRQVFEEIDRDKDGVISDQELKAAFKELANMFHEQDIKKMKNKVKPNKSGKLPYEEFIKAVMSD